MPLAAELAFEKKDGEVPMTPGVKEAPKGICHLHFLLSPVHTNICRKRHPQPWWTPVYLSLGEPIMSDLTCLTCPLSLVTRSPVWSPQIRLRSFWYSYQARPIKPGPQGNSSSSHSNSKRAQELCPGSQVVPSSLPWVTYGLTHCSRAPQRTLLPSFQLSVVWAVWPFIMVKEH